nr:anthocyanidin 3-O-glucosyltransferase [Bacopa monnieri]
MEIEKNGQRSSSSLHVVMFPFFAFGHISPFVQLSNKLSAHGVRISFFSAAGNLPRIQSMLNPNPTSQIIPLPIPQIEGLPPGIESTAELNPTQSELLKVALDQMQPQIKTILSDLRPNFVLFDFAQDWLPTMASDLGIKTVFYSVFIALSTAFLTVPARILNPDSRTYPSLDQLKLPPPGFPSTSLTSVKTFEARDFLYMFKSFHGKPCVYDRVLSGLEGCDVILAKTCDEMEAPYIEYVKSQFKKPVLVSGPVVPGPRADPLEEKWAEWLGQFEAKSVIFCAFGSETFLNDDQIKELALGLELTGFPFLLVFNFPGNLDASAEVRRALPEGFMERVRGKGVISSGWVQQQQILAHMSVGCYLCHAGFSSVVEALVNDCQLVMLPQKGDQFLNSKLVSGDLKAGVEVNRRDEDGYFGKEDIKNAVECVMVDGVGNEIGRIVRNNQKKWKDFLLDRSVHNNFVKDLVKEMEAIARTSSH